MDQYEVLLKYVYENGLPKMDRTGTGTRSIFGYQLRFNLEDSFPLITTKKIFLKAIIHELLWFLKGETNIKYLNENGISIWDEWADENGDLGPIYGYQWRRWPSADGLNIDQISNVISQIKENPSSRRLIVSSWNVGEIERMSIPPCHCLFQLYIVNEKLSCLMYQRSADLFLGLPFNIASYALLTMMIAQVCNLQLNELIITLGDAHIYNNHLDQVKLQLSRSPRPFPKMLINKSIRSIFDFQYKDFELLDYNPYSSIKAPISV